MSSNQPRHKGRDGRGTPTHKGRDGRGTPTHRGSHPIVYPHHMQQPIFQPGYNQRPHPQSIGTVIPPQQLHYPRAFAGTVEQYHGAMAPSQINPPHQQMRFPHGGSHHGRIRSPPHQLSHMRPPSSFRSQDVQPPHSQVQQLMGDPPPPSYESLTQGAHGGMQDADVQPLMEVKPHMTSVTTADVGAECKKKISKTCAPKVETPRNRRESEETSDNCSVAPSEATSCSAVTTYTELDYSCWKDFVDRALPEDNEIDVGAECRKCSKVVLFRGKRVSLLSDLSLRYFAEYIAKSNVQRVIRSLEDDGVAVIIFHSNIDLDEIDAALQESGLLSNCDISCEEVHEPNGLLFCKLETQLDVYDTFEDVVRRELSSHLDGDGDGKFTLESTDDFEDDWVIAKVQLPFQELIGLSHVIEPKSYPVFKELGLVDSESYSEVFTLEEDEWSFQADRAPVLWVTGVNPETKEKDIQKYFRLSVVSSDPKAEMESYQSNSAQLPVNYRKIRMLSVENCDNVLTNLPDGGVSDSKSQVIRINDQPMHFAVSRSNRCAEIDPHVLFAEGSFNQVSREELMCFLAAKTQSAVSQIYFTQDMKLSVIVLSGKGLNNKDHEKMEKSLNIAPEPFHSMKVWRVAPNWELRFAGPTKEVNRFKKNLLDKKLFVLAKYGNMQENKIAVWPAIPVLGCVPLYSCNLQTIHPAPLLLSELMSDRYRKFTMKHAGIAKELKSLHAQLDNPRCPQVICTAKMNDPSISYLYICQHWTESVTDKLEELLNSVSELDETVSHNMWQNLEANIPQNVYYTTLVAKNKRVKIFMTGERSSLEDVEKKIIEEAQKSNKSGNASSKRNSSGSANNADTSASTKEISLTLLQASYISFKKTVDIMTKKFPSITAKIVFGASKACLQIADGNADVYSACQAMVSQQLSKLVGKVEELYNDRALNFINRKKRYWTQEFKANQVYAFFECKDGKLIVMAEKQKMAEDAGRLIRNEVISNQLSDGKIHAAKVKAKKRPGARPKRRAASSSSATPNDRVMLTERQIRFLSYKKIQQKISEKHGVQVQIVDGMINFTGDSSKFGHCQEDVCLELQLLKGIKEKTYSEPVIKPLVQKDNQLIQAIMAKLKEKKIVAFFDCKDTTLNVAAVTSDLANRAWHVIDKELIAKSQENPFDQMFAGLTPGSSSDEGKESRVIGSKFNYLTGMYLRHFLSAQLGGEWSVNVSKDSVSTVCTEKEQVTLKKKVQQLISSLIYCFHLVRKPNVVRKFSVDLENSGSYPEVKTLQEHCLESNVANVRGTAVGHQKLVLDDGRMITVYQGTLFCLEADALLIPVRTDYCVNVTTLGTMLHDADPAAIKSIQRQAGQGSDGKPGSCFEVPSQSATLFSRYIGIVMVDKSLPVLREAVFTALAAANKMHCSSLALNMIGQDGFHINPKDASETLIGTFIKYFQENPLCSVQRVKFCETNKHKVSALETAMDKKGRLFPAKNETGDALSFHLAGKRQKELQKVCKKIDEVFQ